MVKRRRKEAYLAVAASSVVIHWANWNASSAHLESAGMNMAQMPVLVFG